MKMGKQAKDVASLMGVTPWKLCKLEKGNRNWTEELISAYEDALNDITK
ncbi:MAG TPA: helix-turn-helix transcriptional regulator [Verrucomicrobiae bacterium]|nr:helix-turn-helix transcriptional regulator [Verrucomicrobiae bacterium]